MRADTPGDARETMAGLGYSLWCGVVAGALYALVALGYSLIYSILGLINFAHGEMLAVGAYLCWFLGPGYLGLPTLLAMPLAVLGTGLLSLLLGEAVLIPTARRSYSAALVAAIGLSIIIQNTLVLACTSEAKPFFAEQTWSQAKFLGTGISLFHLGLVAGTMALLAVLWFGYFRRTDAGLETRACASNARAARLLGMNLNRVLRVTFFLSGLLAATAGIAAGMDNHIIVPAMGTALGLRAFIGSVIGGVRSFRGAVAGAFLLGLIENIVPYAFISMPGLSAFSAVVSKDSVALVLLAMVLLWRRRGLFAVSYELRP